MPYVYKIKNKVNGKSYIGYTSRKDVESRLNEHFSPSVYTKIDKPFYRAVEKYGRNNFEVEILFEGDENTALQKEIEYIKLMGDYNLHPGGNIPPNQKNKTWNLSEETKNKMRKPKAPRTVEHSKKLSESLKGKTPWNKNKKGVQESFWKGMRDSPRTSKWKIQKNDGDLIIENLVLWCEQNGYKSSTVKGHYYSNKFPYKDILNIEKVE
jgi:group I intron endonuclease